jgi:hypothetical protein
MISLKRFVENSAIGSLASNPDQLEKWMAPKINPDRMRVMLAAAPKSGSTYLTRILSMLLGMKTRDVCADYGRSEQQIYLPKLLCAMDQDTFIGHQHIRASEANVNLLWLFHFKVIVTVRNLADTVVSIADHHVKESISHPMALVTPDIVARMSREEHHWFVIRMILPWYFNFLVSWFEAEKQNYFPIHWVNYDSLIGNPAKEVKSILHFIGLNKSDEEIEAGLSALKVGKETRLNVGIAGRGKAMLSKDQFDAIDQMAHFYQGNDFRFVGVPHGSLSA